MENNIIRLLIPFSLVLDVLTDTVFETGGTIATIKATVVYAVIIYAILKGFRNKYNISLIFILFFIYVMVQVPFSRDPQQSIRMSLKILASLFMFPVGVYLINSPHKIKIFGQSILITIVLYILNFIISQYLGLGESIYTKSKEFVAGNLQDNWNIITYLLLLIPVVRFSFRSHGLINILTFVLLIFLLLSVKRVAILSLIVGYGIFYWRQGEALRAFRIGIGVIVAMLLTFPLYKGVLIQRVIARGDKLDTQTVKVIQEETRYSETIDVWTQAFSFTDLKKSFFGGEAFYSNGNYGDGTYGDRQIHVDYNLIINTIGIIGLYLYFQLHFNIYRRQKKGKILNDTLNIPKSLDSVFWAIFFSQFVTSFGGQMYATTFRMMIYLYLGAYVGIYYNKKFA